MKDWKIAAKALPIGQSLKIECPVCGGSGRTTYISQTADGLRLGPCFRCGGREFVPHGPRSAAEIMAARSVPAPAKTASIPDWAVSLTAPEPAVADGRLWLLRSGLSPEEAHKIGIRFDPKRNRVLIPVSNGYLSRRVQPRDGSPKWIKYGASETTFVLRSGRMPSVVVVVEDILSGIVVSRVGYDTCTILGTSVAYAAALAISNYAKVVCWTDNDAAGHAAFQRLRGKLALFGQTDVRRIITASDPKHIHQAEIRYQIERAIQ